MTVKEILKDYLEKNNYDGLCNEDCGCSINDLILCSDCFEKCEPAYKVYCCDCRDESCVGIDDSSFCYKNFKG